jgi:hypothetical protein
MRCDDITESPCYPSRWNLLFLILNTLHIVLWNIAVRLGQIVVDVVAQIALHCDLLASSRHLRHTTARRELLSKVLRHFLDIQAESLEALHRCDVLSLVPLDTFDEDL